MAFSTAQNVTSSDISGNETWNVGIGPGGPNYGYMSANIVRNTQGLQVFSGTGTIATQASIAVASYYWSGTAPTSWTLTTPTAPYDGEIVEIATDTLISTGITVTAGFGTMNSAFSAQTLTANGSVEFRYSAANTKWYRLR